MHVNLAGIASRGRRADSAIASDSEATADPAPAVAQAFGPSVRTLLSAEDLAFARAIFGHFGEGRFTLNKFYCKIYRGRRRFPSLEEVAAMRKTLAERRGTLAEAPGPQGDEGWRLNTETMQAIR